MMACDAAILRSRRFRPPSSGGAPFFEFLFSEVVQGWCLLPPCPHSGTKKPTADIVMQDVYMVGNNVTWSTVWNTPCTPTTAVAVATIA